MLEKIADRMKLFAIGSQNHKDKLPLKKTWIPKLLKIYVPQTHF